MFRNSFFFCAVFALFFSACDPGSGPGGLGDVRDDIAGGYDAVLVDYEYTCPPNVYMPMVTDGVNVYVDRPCIDPEVCTPEEIASSFKISITARQHDSNTWDFQSYVTVSASGEFDKSYSLLLLDAWSIAAGCHGCYECSCTASDITFTGVARHGELDATYLVLVHAPAGDCRMGATVHGERTVE